MSALLVVGAGGHGGVVADAARATGRWAVIGFVDDTPGRGTVHGLWPVVGTTNDLDALRVRYSAAIVAIGDARRRIELLDRLGAAGYERPVVVHPSAVIGSVVALGAGTVVMPGAVVNIGTRLGAGCIVNTGATVDHDCRLADGVHVCPGAHLAGEVEVGTGTWLGIGCCVRQRIRIGAGVTVGAGAVVVADIGDGRTVAGVPAEDLRR